MDYEGANIPIGPSSPQSELIYHVGTKDKNIGNHGYIGDISADILTQNIDWPKIDQNLWKCKIKLLEMKLEI